MPFAADCTLAHVSQAKICTSGVAALDVWGHFIYRCHSGLVFLFLGILSSGIFCALREDLLEIGEVEEEARQGI